MMRMFADNMAFQKQKTHKTATIRGNSSQVNSRKNPLALDIQGRFSDISRFAQGEKNENSSW